MVLLLLGLGVLLPGGSHGRQQAELDVTLGVATSDVELMPAEVELVFADVATRQPVGSFVVEMAKTRGPQSFHVPVPDSAAQAGWIVAARAPGWWSSAEYVPPDETAAELALASEGLVRFALHSADRAVDTLTAGGVWIDGWVAGRRELERGVHGGPCEVDRESDAPAVLVACPFAEGEVTDVRVRLGPFLPLLRSDLEIGLDTDLGLIEPARGATVSGSLYLPDGATHRLGLRRPDASGTLPWSAWTDSGGVFWFEGLSPGAYELRAFAANGDATGDEWPLRIESVADRIDLGQLSSAAGNVLAVHFGLPFGMEADRLLPVVRPVTLGPDDTVESGGRTIGPDELVAGDFVWKGLPPGNYEVDLADDQGNRWQREIVRFRGHDRLHVELEALALSGRIVRGGEPLEDVMVWFGGLWGAERVSFRSREEGRFEGLLPREGYWPVEVTPSPDCDPCEGGWDTDGWPGFDGEQVEDAGFVEIVADSTGAANVLIDLRAAGASGRVWWRNPESGAVEPVAGATVHVALEPDSVDETDAALSPRYWTSNTDDAGRFRVTGLPEGAFQATAEAWLLERSYQSRPVRFRVTERDVMDDLDLRLTGEKRHAIVVRFGGAPVSAQTFVRDAASDQGGWMNSWTDGTGTATHWLPEETSVVDVVVRSDGLGMVGWRFDVSEGLPTMVDMLPDRGSMRVPKLWNAVLQSPGGVAIPVSVLAGIDDRSGQVREDGDDYVIRALAPGTWTWCLPTSGSPAACSAADVLPWAETRVE